MSAEPQPGTDLRAVIPVEGDSDRVAVQTVARRRGLDLAAAGVEVVGMHGVTNLRHHLRRFGPDGLGLQVAGLCDEREAGYAGRVLGVSRSDMPDRGFFVCCRDLEDELIRALGCPGCRP